MHFAKGYSYIWILIIVIIGAFFMGGGQFMFEDLEELGIQPTLTPAPGVYATATPTPTITPTPTPIASAWSISVTNKGCSVTAPTTAIVDITINSQKDGYMLAEIIQNGVGQYAWSQAVTIHPTETRLNNPFTKAQGFTSNAWRLSLFEGGTRNTTTNRWSGGTPQGTPYIGNALTACN